MEDIVRLVLITFVFLLTSYLSAKGSTEWQFELLSTRMEQRTVEAHSDFDGTHGAFTYEVKLDLYKFTCPICSSVTTKEIQASIDRIRNYFYYVYDEDHNTEKYYGGDCIIQQYPIFYVCSPGCRDKAQKAYDDMMEGKSKSIVELVKSQLEHP
jgi:hypothetical protein